LVFWFNRNAGLALPLIALQYHEVKIDIQFRNVNNCLVWSGSSAPDSSQFSMQDVQLLVDYVFLDSEERRKFAQAGHEYLIEQVQFPSTESVNDGGNNPNTITAKYKLQFNHPCKEIIWALRVGAFNGSGTRNLAGNRGRFLTYTNQDWKWQTDALDYAAENLARGMISLSVPSGLQYETITLNPATTSVTYQSSNLPNLTVTVSYPGTLTATTVSLYLLTQPFMNGTYNLASFLNQFDVTVAFNNSSTAIASYTVDVISHSLNLTDVSVPVEDWTDNRSTTVAGLNPYDVTVVQLNNYGVRLDGKGNPVLDGNIQLNGQDRFEIMQGAWFNYVQPYYYHTHTPADGINLYSFGLEPEKHQPSGTCNLSRIDSTYLNLRLWDPYRSGNNVPRLNIASDTLVYIFAFSYNVLRIMSGMGGLAYSS